MSYHAVEIQWQKMTIADIQGCHKKSCEVSGPLVTGTTMSITFGLGLPF